MNKRTLITIAQYALGVGLLSWVIASYWRIEAHGEQVGLAAALERPWRLAPLFLAGLFCTVGVLLTFVRWFILVRAQELPFSLKDALRLGLIGYYFNSFLPGSVGGDLIKAAFIAREQTRRTVAVATVLVDRIIGFCGLLWLATVLGGLFWATGGLEALAPSGESLTILQTLVGIEAVLTAASLAFWLLLGLVSDQTSQRWAAKLERITRIGGSLAEAWRAVRLYRHRGRSVAISLMLAVLGHISFVFTFYFAAMTLTSPDQIPTLLAHFLLVPVGMTIQSGVPTPAGVGGGELGFGYLYQLAGAAFAFGVLGSLVKRTWEWTLGLIGSLIYLRLRKTIPQTPTMIQSNPGDVS